MDLDEYETRVELRTLRLDDREAVTTLQRACFPAMDPWTEPEYQGQLDRFAEGQLGVFVDGQLVASSSSLIVDYADYGDWHDWEKISDDGRIRNHDPEGDTLYGIEIMVDPDHRGRRLTRRLYDARKALCRRLNLARIIIGGRIPGYGAHADEMSAEDYVEAVIARRLHDPVLTAQLSNGFVLRQLVSNYLPEDTPSGGWATILEWNNLGYVAPSARRRSWRTTRPVRVASVQYPMTRIETWEDFERRCDYFVDTASGYRADFVCFPELFTTQLLCTLPATRPGTSARALAELTPRFVELFAALAVRNNINIVAGSQFRIDDDGALRNVSYLFRRDGSIAEQAKIHPTPNEASWWGVEGGNQLQAIETDRGPVGILICYDVQFPELARLLAERDVRLLFVPYNTNDRNGFIRVSTCARARAIENHMAVVTAGCVGHLPKVDNVDLHYAQSAVYTPSDIQFPRDGIAAEAPAGLETVLIQDLDLEVLRRHRFEGTVRNWEDRRIDLYASSSSKFRGDGSQ